MDKLILRYVFDKKKLSDNDNNVGLLQIEVRQQGTNKCIYISTGIHLYRNQFSDKNGFTCIKHVNGPAITSKGRRIFNQIEAFALSAKCQSLQDVKNYDKEEVCSDLLIPFMRKELARKNITYGSIKQHNVLIHQIEGFGMIRLFSDLTYENILLFDKYLKNTINADSALKKKHTTLRSYIKEAMKVGLISKDPYDLFKMPSGKSKDPVFLEEIEIKKILDYSPDIDKIKKAKDLFVFQMFTGLAYVDMIAFSKESISELSGYKIIRSNRAKTDESFISLFLPEAEEIAEKYNYELPRISNQKYNDYLKLLAAGAGINKNLTTHLARHTYATWLLNKGIPIETVSRCLGHSNIKQTQHYARLLGKKVISDMAVLLKKEEDDNV